MKSNIRNSQNSHFTWEFFYGKFVEIILKQRTYSMQEISHKFVSIFCCNFLLTQIPRCKVTLYYIMPHNYNMSAHYHACTICFRLKNKLQLQLPLIWNAFSCNHDPCNSFEEKRRFKSFSAKKQNKTKTIASIANTDHTIM